MRTGLDGNSYPIEKRIHPAWPCFSCWVGTGLDMHFYQFHIGDYISHTRHLTLLEDLAYRRLLDHYYLHEEPISSTNIARLINMREHEADVIAVLEEFWTATEAGYINLRADEEIAKYRQLREDGKRGAAKRWGADSPPIAPPSPPHGPPNATPIATIDQEPRTMNQEPIYIKAKASHPTGSLPGCPHKQILKLWKENLPHLSQPRAWEGARQQALKARWTQAAKKSEYSSGYTTLEGGLEWWRDFFAYIAKDTKLAHGFEHNGRLWLPDLPWVLNATNFAKIVDGKYAK